MAHVAQVFREQLIRIPRADLLLTLIYTFYADCLFILKLATKDPVLVYFPKTL